MFKSFEWSYHTDRHQYYNDFSTRNDLYAKTSGGSFVAALVFFVMTASIAIFLLLTALVEWLSVVTGSFILSSLIVGGFFAVLAAVIYLLAIREGVERIRDQVETVYDVARAAKEGYEWLTDKFLLLMQLREMRK